MTTERRRKLLERFTNRGWRIGVCGSSDRSMCVAYRQTPRRTRIVRATRPNEGYFPFDEVVDDVLGVLTKGRGQ